MTNKLGCYLKNFPHACNWPAYHHHHLINKSMLAGNREALAYVETVRPDLFIVRICTNSNISRLADSPEARAFMLRKKVDEFGETDVANALEDLRLFYKTERPELRLTAMI